MNRWRELRIDSYIKPNATDREILRASRIAMISITAMGTAIALSTPKLMWLFLIYSALSSAGLFPALFALYSRRVTAKALSWSIGAGLLLGLPYSIYANVTESPVHIAVSALVSVAVGLVILSASTIRANRVQKSSFNPRFQLTT